MAYKFQFGAARMSGSLLQEEGVETTTLNATGDVDLGNATSDTVTVTGQFDSDLIPSTDSARDLGSSAKQWAEAHIDTGYIDAITTGGLTATANLDIGAYDLRAATLTADGLTSSRVVFAGANGVLSDDSDFTFATDTLTVTKIGAFEAAGAIDFSDEAMTNVNIDSGAIDGTVIGANSAAAGTFAAVVGTTGGFSGAVTVASLAVDNDGTVGCDADSDLLTLAAQKVTLASDAALQFADAGEKISRSGDGYLDLLAGTKINMSGAVAMNSTLSTAGAATVASLVCTAGATVGGGYGSSGATITTAGALSIDGAFVGDSSLTIAGAATLNGNVTLGNAASDDITFTGAMASGIVPKTDSSYDLGSNSNRWSTLYVDSIVGADSKFDIEERSSGQTISAGTDFAVCTSGNGSTVTLPTAVAGKSLYIKLSSSVGDQIIAAGSNDFIEGTLGNIRLESTGSAVQLVAVDDGTWFIV